MYAERHVVEITTNGDGNGVGYSPVVTGAIETIRYVKDSGADAYASGVDLSITAEATGETIWAQNDVNASATVAPRQATHSTAGAAALYASGGAAVNDKIVLANDRVKITVSSGGDTKVGTFHVLVG